MNAEVLGTAEERKRVHSGLWIIESQSGLGWKGPYI